MNYFVTLRIPSECGKIWTKKTPYLDTFHAVLRLSFYGDRRKICIKQTIVHLYGQDQVRAAVALTTRKLCIWENVHRQSEGVHLTLRPHIFSVQVKSGACYITGQWFAKSSDKIKET